MDSRRGSREVEEVMVVTKVMSHARLVKSVGGTSSNRGGTTRRQTNLSSSSSSSSSSSFVEENKKEKCDARAFRRSLNKTGRYVRKPTHDKDSKDLMDEHGVGYSSTGIVALMRDNGYTHQIGDVTIKLAESYGFCWGVERAVQMAYEARRAYPGKQLHITNEIIHNPSVNKRLEQMGVKFIEDRGENLGKDFSEVEEGDVCILLAFGASVHEMKILNDKRVQIVDTTCPYVSKVWNS